LDVEGYLGVRMVDLKNLVSIYVDFNITKFSSAGG